MDANSVDACWSCPAPAVCVCVCVCACEYVFLFGIGLHYYACYTSFSTLAPAADAPVVVFGCHLCFDFSRATQRNATRHGAAMAAQQIELIQENGIIKQQARAR